MVTVDFPGAERMLSGIWQRHLSWGTKQDGDEGASLLGKATREKFGV